MSKPKLFLVCTGLGLTTRGFETYIADLADALNESDFKYPIEVYAGGDFKGRQFKSKKIPCIGRNNKVINLLFDSAIASELELYSFFLFFLFPLTFRKPRAIYLGEYKLYCYLFKWRKLFRLNYSLILYTGGQVYPSLFDTKKDFVHHITDIYVDKLIAQAFPANRQFILPHFIQPGKLLQLADIDLIQKQAKGKKIIISVGLIDKTIKRMDLLLNMLADHANAYYPVILGEYTSDTPAIRSLLLAFFGEGNFYMNRVPREQVFSYLVAADAFVLLSPKESFGLVYLEALSAGVPVICCDFYESRFVLKGNAFFLKEEDISHLPVFLSRVIYEDDYDKKKSREQFVRLNYSWECLREHYIDMFSKAISHDK
jgi:glycosyltransferase involved in cell wall biosynthesis